MIHCPCGGTEFRATQKAYLSVVVAVDDTGHAVFIREDSQDGTRPGVTECDAPEGLTCLACKREFETADDVRQAAVEAELDVEAQP